MSGAEEERKRAARAEQVALFRYRLIREAADPALSTRQRGRMVREIASRAHEGPFGDPVIVSRGTADRWIRAWREGGFAALAPPARQVTPRTDAAVLDLAAALKRENPARTAAQVRRILRESCRAGRRRTGPCSGCSSGWSCRTRPDGERRQVFGRFECARAERDVDRGRSARAAVGGPEVVSVRVHRRPLQGRDGRPLVASRRRGPDGRRVPPGPGRPAAFRGPATSITAARLLTRGCCAAAAS